jgi:hypothetical protein
MVQRTIRTHRRDVPVDEPGHRLRRLEAVEVGAEVDRPILGKQRKEERGEKTTLARTFF